MSNNDLWGWVFFGSYVLAFAFWIVIALSDYVMRWHMAKTMGAVPESLKLPATEIKNEPAQPRSVAFTSGKQEGTEGSAFSLSREELMAVQGMIRHLIWEARQGKEQSKNRSILAGFGVKRGGSSRYQRAAEIYDLLIVSAFPAVEADRERQERERKGAA